MLSVFVWTIEDVFGLAVLVILLLALIGRFLYELAGAVWVDLRYAFRRWRKKAHRTDDLG